MTEIAVSTAAELSAALQTAQAGDEILLEAGDYGAFNFDGYSYSDYVTIRSADGSQGATFDAISVTGSSHIRIDGVHVESPSNGSSASSIVSVRNSDHIQFLNSEVNGPVDNVYEGHRGIHAQDSSHVVFSGLDIHDVDNGLVVTGGVTDLVISENSFDYLGNDSMKLIGITGVLIENNTGPRHIFPTPNAHVDFIQFQGSGSSDIVIRGNVFLPETSTAVQGIFLGDVTYTNVLIEQNIIYNSLVRGISVDSTSSGIVVRNNTVLTVPNEGHKASAIILPPGSVSEGNITGSFDGGPNGLNFYAEWDNPDSAYYYDELFVNASVGWGVTLEDLRPVEGGVADNPDLGAYQRLMELLEGAAARPVAGADEVTVVEDGSVTLDVLANDSDPEGTALELVSVGNPANGTAEINADGTVTYTPDANFFGEDSFSYTIRNADGATQTGRVTVSVTGIDDDAPVAEFDLANVIQGREAVIDVLANDFDPDGGPLTLLNHTDTAKGALTDLGNGRFSYLADEDATGTDSFSYTIQDASGATATATVTVNIQELGALPAPVFMAAGTGSPQVIAHDPAMAQDAGALELVFTADQLTARQGLFSKDSSGFDNGGHLTILLEGSDLLIRLQSSTATHEIRIEDAVTVGLAHHFALTFGTGGMQVYLDGVLMGSDSYTGGLAGNAEPIVIGANQWASGDGVADQLQDPFSGTVSTVNLYDQALDAGQVAILAQLEGGPVEDPNTAPDAVNDVAGTAQDTPIIIDVRANDSDAENDALSVVSVGDAANGTVALNDDGTVTYTPDAGFSGPDSFTYEVSDGALTSAATVAITIEAAPDPEPPVGDVVVSSAAELLAALGTAQGGDTILLAAGDYGAVSLNGFTFDSDVAIVSNTPQGAVFDSLEVRDSAHLIIDGIHVDHPTDGARYSALVDIAGASEHITFINSEINGSVDASYDGAYGIRVDVGTSFIDVSDNDVHHVRHGAVFFGTTDLTVSGNTTNYIGEDSFKFAGITRAQIEDNTGASIYRSADSGVHHDFIQFQGNASDVVLSGNTMLLQEITPNGVVQGIFLKDGVYNDILIENNIIYTNTVNALYVNAGTGGGGITVRQNTVLSAPDKTIWGNADIRIVSVDGGYVVENNIVDRVVDSVGTGTVQNNLSLQWEDPDAPNHYDDVYVGATAGSTATIEDFRPVAGGPGDFGSGIGAEQRIAEIIENEVLQGTSGDDTIEGNTGDDTIDGGAGNDSLDGGEGIDTLSFASLAAAENEVNNFAFGVIVDLNRQGEAQDTGQGTDIFENFENLEGSDFNDGLFGDAGDNTISGGGGRDFLTGESGNDTLFGGAGFDVIDGGSGADHLFGGTTGGGAIETDIVAYFGATGPLTFNFGTSFSELEAGTSSEVMDDMIGADFEGVGGASDFSNTFNAENISTTTFFFGGQQSDTFFGGSSTDQLLGGGGSDVIYGNDGNDALIGDAGDDHLFGGAGADFFFLYGINDGHDRIYDLELGVDVISFTGGNVTAVRFQDIDAGGGAEMDTLLTYEINGVDYGTITILDHDAATVETFADILF